MKIPAGFLTPTDLNAVASKDSGYINNKGAKLYAMEEYPAAVEYYRLAAAMGDVHAVSNLGYCYLYGRAMEPDVQLAIAYFQTAAMKGDVDAAYKLGDIYGRDKWGVMDTEMSLYYYRMAVGLIAPDLGNDARSVVFCDRLTDYPSLCLAMGRAFMPGGMLNTDVETAFCFLKKAEEGYAIQLANGQKMYEKSMEQVQQLLDNPVFDSIGFKFRDMFDDDIGEFEDE
ncbi:MAG: tetratricopeptide repeat protein [Clostridia bacterium]|nr:tetratricopeptide repeat protein [Clostridia bacterium]